MRQAIDKLYTTLGIVTLAQAMILSKCVAAYLEIDCGLMDSITARAE